MSRNPLGVPAITPAPLPYWYVEHTALTRQKLSRASRPPVARQPCCSRAPAARCHFSILKCRAPCRRQAHRALTRHSYEEDWEARNARRGHRLAPQRGFPKHLLREVALWRQGDATAGVSYGVAAGSGLVAPNRRPALPPPRASRHFQQTSTSASVSVERCAPSV